MSNPFLIIVRNRVLPLSVLKKINYPLFRYYMNNRNIVKRRIESEGIQILNDLFTKNTYRNIKLFLTYYYGETVNMNVLREKDRTIYNYISERGKPREVIEEMGFKVEYTKFKRSMEYIMAELNRIADDDGFIYKINDPTLYSKLQYRQRKEGFSSVKDYVETLGFHYGINSERLFNLSKQGKSISQIAKLMSISYTTVSKILKEIEGK